MRAIETALAAPSRSCVTRVERTGAAITGFYEPATGSVQYILADPVTGRCAIIDPVLDFDPRSAAVVTASADWLLSHMTAHGLTLDWILDTHPHADHLSAAGYLHAKTGAPTATGEKVVEVQRLWKDVYNLGAEFCTDGSQWDRLLADGESFRVGMLDVRVMLSPGHTLSSVSYVTSGCAFIHDTLFMPDSGTARADFPGANPRRLWRSIQQILQLPGETRLFTGHDYRPDSRVAMWESTVGLQKRHNAHVTANDEDSFVAMRSARDRHLPAPAAMLAALQVNIAGGRLPAPEANGRRYLKIPLDLSGSEFNPVNSPVLGLVA